MFLLIFLRFRGVGWGGRELNNINTRIPDIASSISIILVIELRKLLNYFIVNIFSRLPKLYISDMFQTISIMYFHIQHFSFKLY